MQYVAEKRACNALMMTSVDLPICFITALLTNISIMINNVINIYVRFKSLESVLFLPKRKKYFYSAKTL